MNSVMLIGRILFAFMFLSSGINHLVKAEAPAHKLKMCDLADTLRLSRSGLTRRMDGVVKAKYVVRIQDKDDRRVSFAHLTPRGFEFLKKIAPLHLKDVRSRMIDLLNESEIKALGSAFAKINAHLRTTE